MYETIAEEIVLINQLISFNVIMDTAVYVYRGVYELFFYIWIIH